VRVGIVLGAGGVTGDAFHRGVLRAVRDAGYDARDAEVIVGTSAGSMVGAFLRKPGQRAATGVDDVLHGIGKSLIFAVLIVLVGAVNGANAKGGADGIGRQTTRSVVHAISAIVITDMLFAFLTTR